jgi:hypothetical protein
MEMQNEYIAERSLVYCVSPPGENQWTKEAYGSEHGKITTSHTYIYKLIISTI